MQGIEVGTGPDAGQRDTRPTGAPGTQPYAQNSSRFTGRRIFLFRNKSVRAKTNSTQAPAQSPDTHNSCSWAHGVSTWRQGPEPDTPLLSPRVHHRKLRQSRDWHPSTPLKCDSVTSPNTCPQTSME